MVKSGTRKPKKKRYIITLTCLLSVFSYSGVALADGIRESGLSEWIALHLDFLHSIPYILITPSVAIIVAIVTEFTSNNATATIFLPLLAEVSLSLNIHPLFLMVTATIASSFSFMLPIATPPNAVAYTAGKLRMTDLAIPGFLLKCAGIFLLSVLMPTLGNHTNLGFEFCISMNIKKIDHNNSHHMASIFSKHLCMKGFQHMTSGQQVMALFSQLVFRGVGTVVFNLDQKFQN